MEENLKKGVCKMCKIKASCFDKIQKDLVSPKILNSDGLCIFCERESKGKFPEGIELKQPTTQRRIGTEVFSKSGAVDENIYLTV
jgi:hypothetical protein